MIGYSLVGWWSLASGGRTWVWTMRPSVICFGGTWSSCRRWPVQRSTKPSPSAWAFAHSADKASGSSRNRAPQSSTTTATVALASVCPGAAQNTSLRWPHGYSTTHGRPGGHTRRNTPGPSSPHDLWLESHYRWARSAQQPCLIYKKLFNTVHRSAGADSWG